MARMVPPAYPTDTVSVAERKLFAALEDALDDEFTVIHSLPWLDDTRRALQEGECDFVVMHPLHGLLVIETKSGDSTYDGPTKSWYRSDGTKLNKDPFLQAQKTVHHLNKILRRDVAGWSQANPPFGYAVVFPDTDKIIGSFPPHVLPQIVILEPELRDLQQRIVSVLGHYKEPKARLKRETYDRAIDRLLPEFQIVRSLASQIADQDESLARLTAAQIQLLEAMRGNRRLLVEGCAGSGKTMLALEKAMRLADAGQRVLLLCFNIPLASWMRSRVIGAGSDIDVFHFHGLCENVVVRQGMEFPVPEESPDEFWNMEAPELLLKALPGHPDRYDAVIVDEGQDFCSHWWLPVQEMLADAGTGSFYIFHDPKQNIFRREHDFPFTEPTVQLDINCRNTHQIATYVNELAGIDARVASFRVEGLDPVEHVVGSDEEELYETEQTLAMLLKDERLDPSQIVIIGKRRFEHSPYANALAWNGIQIVDNVDAVDRENVVRYATVYRFKGLEADCAILTGFPRPTDEQSSRELYVAASRARSLLHIMYRE